MTNTQPVEQFFALISRGDVTGAFAMIHDGATWWSAGGDRLPFAGSKTKAEFLDAMRGVGALFPDGVKLVPTGLVAEGDRVAVELEGHAVTRDGRSYENRYHTAIPFRDGLIFDVREYHDTLYAKVVIIDGE